MSICLPIFIKSLLKWEFVTVTERAAMRKRSCILRGETIVNFLCCFFCISWFLISSPSRMERSLPPTDLSQTTRGSIIRWRAGSGVFNQGIPETMLWVTRSRINSALEVHESLESNESSEVISLSVLCRGEERRTYMRAVFVCVTH